MVQDEIRKGPWTEQEDILLVNFVHLFGDRRWDFIAKVSGGREFLGKLPGRTDNEIKNYWRTHMRKTAQEKKRAIPISPSSSSSNCHSSSSTVTAVDSLPSSGTGNIVSFYDTGGLDMAGKKNSPEFEDGNGYSMDDIWKDIDMSEENTVIKPLSDNYSQQGCNFSWEYCWDTLWKMDDEEESKMFFPPNQLVSCFDFGRESVTG
ncbi:hypothetical protein GOBAR_AA02324 [Gossypium barbadense]|uniref:Myb-like domain-containing protein n=1 Tax=Gossypium barbadense TaxID=3634 RepID=A0A2P5YRN8_GOSBA|nr:hypothetical protein GOBAR_AA02324 [Gossypium barbadense]